MVLLFGQIWTGVFWLSAGGWSIDTTDTQSADAIIERVELTMNGSDTNEREGTS